MFSLLEELTPNNKGNHRFKSRLYVNYIKIILMTSFFWIILDIFFIYFCGGYFQASECKRAVTRDDPYYSQFVTEGYAEGSFVESHVEGSYFPWSICLFK